MIVISCDLYGVPGDHAPLAVRLVYTIHTHNLIGCELKVFRKG